MKKDNRLCVYKDAFAEDGFVAKTAALTFARINRIGGKWYVWYYTKHVQEAFAKLREALAKVNEEFTAWYRDNG